MSFAAIRVVLGQRLRFTPFVGRGFVIQDEKTSGTSGGTGSVGVNTRDLNTVIANTISGAFLGINQFTLPVGTYEIKARAPSVNTQRNRIYLYNVTDAADALVGTSSHVNAGGFVGGGFAWLLGRFTIAGTKTFEIRHIIGGTDSSNTFGRSVADSAGNNEVYTRIAILKV